MRASQDPFVACLSGDIDSGVEEDIPRLTSFLRTLARHGIQATIPVTAKAAQDFPERIAFILQKGHEVAGHGDVHVGFQGPVQSQVRRLKDMIRVLEESIGIRPRGFRAPYLVCDRHTLPALGQVGLEYDSSLTVLEPLIYVANMLRRRRDTHPPSRFLAGLWYRGLARSMVSGPYWAGNVLEFPVLDLDDWFLIEWHDGPRYSPEESRDLGEVWLRALRNMMKFRWNRCLVLQAHPGRMSPDFLPALDWFLTQARELPVQFLTLAQATDMFRTGGSRNPVPGQTMKSEKSGHS